MKSLFLFSIITLLTGNPIIALAVILLVYLFIDRRFIGLIPDFTAPLRARARAGDLERAVRANPYNGDALLELGVLYYNRKKYNKSVDFLERAYERMKDWPDVHLYLGAALYETGQVERGLSEIAQAVEMNPKVAHGLPYIYLLRAALDKNDGSITGDLENRLLRSGSVQALFTAGKLFFRHGEKNRARKFFNEVLDCYRLSSPTFRRSYRRMMIMSRFYLGRL